MRITCAPTVGGNVYRFDRTDDSFYRDLQALIPFLLKARTEIEIGPTDVDADVLLTVGPLLDELDAQFRQWAKRHLSSKFQGTRIT